MTFFKGRHLSSGKAIKHHHNAQQTTENSLFVIKSLDRGRDMPAACMPPSSVLYKQLPNERLLFGHIASSRSYYFILFDVHYMYLVSYMLCAQVNTMHLSKKSDIALVSLSEGHFIGHPKEQGQDQYSKENILVFILSLLNIDHTIFCCPSTKSDSYLKIVNTYTIIINT